MLKFPSIIIFLVLIMLSAQTQSFPVGKPFHEGYLRVSAIHELWFAEYGNPKGVPVVVLHGGPGGGCNKEMTFFDPGFWRVILLDQRGARRSRPFGELRDNTTQDLINDLELLRNKLGIKKWLLFGGSWGSMLALTYAEAHPEPVLGLILRGVFLGRNSDTLNVWYGLGDFFPDAWQEYHDYIPADEQADLMQAYQRRVMSSDQQVALSAARAFIKYDTIASFLKLSPQQLQTFLADDVMTLGVARIFIHYSVNHFFVRENQILDNIGKINHLPLIIVHGRYDVITRPKGAWELHQRWPGSELVLVDASGHASSEPGISEALAAATEKMKNQHGADFQQTVTF